MKFNKWLDSGDDLVEAVCWIAIGSAVAVIVYQGIRYFM